MKSEKLGIKLIPNSSFLIEEAQASEEKTMVNKKIWLGMLVLTFGMMVVGCDNGNDGGKTVTFSLNKVNSTTFSVTVDGAKWRSNVSSDRASLPSLVRVTGTAQRPSDGATVYVGYSSFNLTRTNDTMITFTLLYDYVIYTVSVTLELSDLNGMNTTDGGRTDEYKVNRSSITLP